MDESEKMAKMRGLSTDPRLIMELFSMLRRRLMKDYKEESLALRLNGKQFADLADGAASDGLAKAYFQRERWNSEKGPFHHWAFLKSKRFMRREFDKIWRERQYQELEKSELRTQRAGWGRELEYSPWKTVENRDKLREAFASMTREQAEAAYLNVWEGYCIQEIAEMTGRSAGAVYALIRRGRAAAERARRSRDPS